MSSDARVFDLMALTRLYDAISESDGVALEVLEALIAEMSESEMSIADLNAYRQGRKPWKKLRDEVVPVSHLLRAKFPRSTRVRFPLNDHPPDAWLTIEGRNAVGIEVTGAMARSRVEVARNMAANGTVPGFIGLQDDAKNVDFEAAKARGRIVHSASAVNAALETGIRKQLRAKNHSKYEGMILLVVCGIHSSPNRTEEEWRKILGDEAMELPFSQVFLIDATSGKRVFQLR